MIAAISKKDSHGVHCEWYNTGRCNYCSKREKALETFRRRYCQTRRGQASTRVSSVEHLWLCSRPAKIAPCSRDLRPMMPELQGSRTQKPHAAFGNWHHESATINPSTWKVYYDTLNPEFCNKTLESRFPTGKTSELPWDFLFLFQPKHWKYGKRRRKQRRRRRMRRKRKTCTKHKAEIENFKIWISSIKNVLYHHLTSNFHHCRFFL